MSEENKPTIEQEIEKGHTNLDELHELLLMLKENNAVHDKQSEEIAALKTDIGNKNDEITNLRSMVETFKMDLTKAKEQKDVAAKALHANMVNIEKQRLAYESHVLEIQEWKDKYMRIKRKVEMLATEIDDEPKSPKRLKTDE